ncbi:MAG: N-acetylmuramoyl-L-alanine amidase [Bryobacteraceae bacterium]
MVWRNLIGAGVTGVLIAGLVLVTPLDAAKRRRSSTAKSSTKKTATPDAKSDGASASEPSTDGIKVTSVRYWSLGEVTRVAIESTSTFKYHAERLSNPDRLFFDVRGAKLELEKRTPMKSGMNVIEVGDNVLKQIRIAETQPGTTRVVLDLDGKLEYTVSQLTNPDRLMIEIQAPEGRTSLTTSRSTHNELSGREIANGRAPSSVEAKIPPAPQPVEAASVASLPPARPRSAKVFEPPPIRPAVRRELPRQELIAPLESARLANKKPRSAPGPSPTTLAGLTRSDRALLRPPAEPRPVERAPETTGPESSREPSAAALPAKIGASGGSRSLTRVLGLKLGRVVIDAGHGGRDHGTTGPSGLTEKELVLDVAKKLGAFLEDRLGSEVILTRTEDVQVPLEERGPIANERKADLFISIHANSSPLRSVTGVETYYLSFTTSKTALDVAARENASSTKSIHDLGDLLKKIALKDKVDESREFAAKVQDALYAFSAKSNGVARNRGVKKAPFVVLIGANMPAVLVEIGFISNTTDEVLMKRSDHRQKIAEALYKGVAAYASTLSHFDVAKRE